MNTNDGPVLACLQGVRRRRGAVQALDGVDLELPAGRVTALLGINGAGKTTAIEVLLGLQPADAGQATLLGRSPFERDAKAQVGAMLQQIPLPERLTVAELLALVRSWYATPRSMTDCVALAGLDGLLGRRYGRLSGVQQRRVQFALVLSLCARRAWRTGRYPIFEEITCTRSKLPCRLRPRAPYC